MKCVICGKEGTEGSMKHPYCKECFYNNFVDYDEYTEWIWSKH